MLAFAKLCWARWTGIAHKIADFQARIVLSAFFLVVKEAFIADVESFGAKEAVGAISSGAFRE